VGSRQSLHRVISFPRRQERELKGKRPERPLHTPSNISVIPATVPVCLIHGSLRTLFLSGLRLRSYEASCPVSKGDSDQARRSPTPSFIGVGTNIFGKNGLAFLPNHLWKGDAGVDRANNGLDTITPDKCLIVSGEGGAVFLVTKPRTFPPPWKPNRITSTARKTTDKQVKC
jgi:hypothetical protein